jgi:hypothetical protein
MRIGSDFSFHAIPTVFTCLTVTRRTSDPTGIVLSTRTGFASRTVNTLLAGVTV